MLSTTRHISPQITAVPCFRPSATWKRAETTSTKPTQLSFSGHARQLSIQPRATFLDALFSGGSQSKKGGAKQKANELVSDLFDLIGKKGNRPKIEEDDAILEIVNELRRLNVTKNPSKSPLLIGTWDARYLTAATIPPNALNPYYDIGDGTIEGTFTFSVFGFLSAKASRFGSWAPNGSNAFLINFEQQTINKSILGVERKDLDVQSQCNIYHLDEQCLILERAISEKPGITTCIQIFDRRNANPSKAVVEETAASDISVGGVAKVARRTGAATKAERSYQQRQQNSTKADRAVTAVEAKEAREEALRLQKEKAAAEREAALQLKAEIKASVDGFNERLKQAQEQKREAMAALREFQKENSGPLKEVVAFKQDMESIDGEIASLAEEIDVMTENQKSYAQEIKDCRRELTDLERKLATF